MTIETQIDLSAWAQSFESSAEWRREKAVEYPEDAERNLAAAKELESLAAQFNAGDVDPELAAQYEALGEGDSAHRTSEVENELRKQVGFHRSFETADDFVRVILDEVRA